MITNCKNCGAPLHGSVCEYCGTEYRENLPFQNIYVNVEHPKCRVLKSVINIPREIVKQDPDGISEYATNNLAKSLAEGLKEYMELEQTYDPMLMCYRISAKARVLEKDFRY